MHMINEWLECALQTYLSHFWLSGESAGRTEIHVNLILAFQFKSNSTLDNHYC